MVKIITGMEVSPVITTRVISRATLARASRVLSAMAGLPCYIC